MVKETKTSQTAKELKKEGEKAAKNLKKDVEKASQKADKNLKKAEDKLDKSMKKAKKFATDTLDVVEASAEGYLSEQKIVNALTYIPYGIGPVLMYFF